ncbi:Oxidoreductase ptaL [Golovinomyces cichoracearum]|uniref:Oxidoreductase ptaL n=1 Tax=Golovinomyces cichoracearum TaxID=62708 RepID=A0A420ISU8_9PEZI|nr:Oxidoreductase ptaL [Golovinomyces cichoracearum]
MAKTILILGASYVGLSVAHSYSLLKNTLKNNRDDYKVVLVSPTTHHYWNMASVRAIVPGQFPDEKLFASISDGLDKYGDLVDFVIGIATQLDTSSKTVAISTADGEKQLHYEILVIATGSRAKSKEELPWHSSLSGYEASKQTLHKFQEAVKNAKTIALGGGGPTGVETAGELGYEYGKDKEISIITSSSKLLLDGTPAMSSTADAELRKLHVKIIYNTKITDARTTTNGQTELTLSDGSTKTVDLYLPTVGSIANTDFVPEKYLNENKHIMVDDFFRVKGAPEVWAAGDVTDLEPSQYVYAEKQVPVLVNNLSMVIDGKEPTAYKPGPAILGVTLGRCKATGRLGPIRLPSIVLWYAKGRTLGTQDLQPLVSGRKF